MKTSTTSQLKRLFNHINLVQMDPSQEWRALRIKLCEAIFRPSRWQEKRERKEILQKCSANILFYFFINCTQYVKLVCAGCLICIGPHCQLQRRTHHLLSQLRGLLIIVTTIWPIRMCLGTWYTRCGSFLHFKKSTNLPYIEVKRTLCKPIEEHPLYRTENLKGERPEKTKVR